MEDAETFDVKKRFKGLILALARLWARQGCVIIKNPLSNGVGAGYFSSQWLFYVSIGPEPIEQCLCATVSSSLADGRYGQKS